MSNEFIKQLTTKIISEQKELAALRKRKETLVSNTSTGTEAKRIEAEIQAKTTIIKNAQNKIYEKQQAEQNRIEAEQAKQAANNLKVSKFNFFKSQAVGRAPQAKEKPIKSTVPPPWKKNDAAYQSFLTSSSAAASVRSAPIIVPAINTVSVKPSQDSKWQMWMQQWLKENPITNESKIIRVTKDPTGIFHTDILVRGSDIQKEVLRDGESRLFLVKPIGNRYEIRLINMSSVLPSRSMDVSSKSTSKLTDMSDIDHVIQSLKRIATLINTIPKKKKTGILEETNVAKAKSILTSIKAELEIASPFAVTIKNARIQKGDNIHNVNKAIEAITKFTALTGALEKLIRRSNSSHASEADLAALEAEVEADRLAADAELEELEEELVANDAKKIQSAQFKAKMQASAEKIRGKNNT